MKTYEYSVIKLDNIENLSVELKSISPGWRLYSMVSGVPMYLVLEKVTDDTADAIQRAMNVIERLIREREPIDAIPTA